MSLNERIQTKVWWNMYEISDDYLQLLPVVRYRNRVKDEHGNERIVKFYLLDQLP